MQINHFFTICFFNQFQQYLKFNIWEIADITLQFLKNRKTYMAQFVKLNAILCSIIRKKVHLQKILDKRLKTLEVENYLQLWLQQKKEGLF